MDTLNKSSKNDEVSQYYGATLEKKYGCDRKYNSITFNGIKPSELI